MSDARSRILARVSAGLGRSLPASVPRVPRAPAPMARAVEDLRADFRSRALSLQSSVEEVADLTQVPAAVAAYLASQNLAPGPAVAWPEFADLPWSAAGLSVAARPAAAEDRVGITGCFRAIAETGTLLLHSGAGHSATVSLLPETHIAIVPAGRIVARMEQAFAAVLSEHGELPRALNFISGPSRTADIEQTIVIGAHGPRRVHLLIVG